MTDSTVRLRESPSQTAGPYVHIGCAPNTCGVKGLYETDLGSVMVFNDTPGERITITGHVFDGAGEPLKDALIEIWQADHAGRYPASDQAETESRFTGWGRQITDLDTGRYTFETIRPGPVAMSPERRQAPHISFWIVARGINLGLSTRMYFPDATDANAACPVLSKVQEEHRATLIAQNRDGAYVFDIHLQGENETVFFDI